METTCKLQCSQCGRTAIRPFSAVIRMVKLNRARCTYCGGQFDFPPAFQNEVDEAFSVAGWDLRQSVEYSCESCCQPMERPLGDLVEMIRRRDTRCTTCGGSLAFPRQVVEVSKALGHQFDRERFKFPCPLCLRSRFNDPDLPESILRCQYCGASFRAPSASGGTPRIPPLQGQLASIDAVKTLAERLDRNPYGWVADVLVARAALNELVLEDAVLVADRLERLDSWKPRNYDEPYIPIPIVEAETVLPFLLFPDETFVSDRSVEGEVDLIFVIGESTPLVSTDVAVRILALCFGFPQISIPRSEESRTPDQRRLRLTLRSHTDGVFVGFKTQINNEAPTPVPAEVLSAFGERLAMQRDDLFSYYALLALFGGWAGRTSVINATVDAIQSRLRAFGPPLSTRAELLASAITLCTRRHSHEGQGQS